MHAPLRLPKVACMATLPAFDAALIQRYDRLGPRYTSYPSALQFTDAFDAAAYGAAAERSRCDRPGEPLSVYVHVPFCASPCFYCGCSRIITRQFDRAAPYVRVLEKEIALQGALFEGLRRIEQLHFGGGTPTFLTVAQIGRVMDALDREFGLVEGEGREYSIEIDPRTIHPDTLAELAGLGFNRISLGVQDFDPRVQQAVNRVQSVKDTLDLVQRARQLGFRSVSVDLIYGLPYQTPQSWRRTLDVIVAAQPDRIAAYSYAHLPERFKAQRQIDAATLPTAAEKLALLALTIERFTAAGYEYIGMDHFARPDDELARARREGSLQRNFQGYATRGGLELIGLGMTSIGQLDDAFSQNARQLDRYYAAVNEGRLPIEKGYRLTADDRLRRDVIMGIMCRDGVRFADIERDHGIRFADHFATELGRLRPLEADGLVARDAGGIRVTPSGRLLLRAIAMVFDAYAIPPATSAPRRHSAVI
jgi:oxygen-independent coproporphyrinogen-3 oxidase